MKKLFKALLLPCALVLLMGADNQEARYQNLGGKIMCSCGCAQMLLKCNHVGCPDSPVQLAELRTAINTGMTDQQVLDSFAAKYGNTVLAAPRTHGFDLVAWIAPFAVLAAALLGTVLLVRHWSVGKKEVAQQASTPEMDAIHDRIRRETGSEGGY